MIYGSDMPRWIKTGWVSNIAHRNDIPPMEHRVAKVESFQHAMENLMCDSFLCSLAWGTLISQHRHLPHPLQAIIPPHLWWILPAFHHDPAPGNGDACSEGPPWSRKHCYRNSENGTPFPARILPNDWKDVKSEYGKGQFKVSKYTNDHIISVQSPNIEDLNLPPALFFSQSKLLSSLSVLFSCPCPFPQTGLRI